ncbi:MAG: phytoene/squalene synthase family protein [Anaerolineae bacterium]
MKHPTRFDHYQMLRLVSRTFALSIERLPGLLRDAITTAYLMFRVSDFLEDNEQMPPERKVELLTLWVAVMSGDLDPGALTNLLLDTSPDDPEAAVARHADEVMRLLRRLPPELQGYILAEAVESARGMARWQARGPVVRDEADLDDYMFEVAGRVGHMLTHIFAWYYRPLRALKEEMLPLAREFGLALQTVNVIRGLRKDYERGWVFVPESFCAQVGLRPPDLFKPANLEQSMQVVDMLAAKAERHLRSGLSYIQRIPRRYHRIRLACMWPLFFAVRTLALSRGNRRVLEAEAKIDRTEVMQIMVDTQIHGWSNQWLEEYYQRLNS